MDDTDNKDNIHICNAAVLKDGTYICNVVNRECTEYMEEDCELKQGFRKVFKEIRG